MCIAQVFYFCKMHIVIEWDFISVRDDNDTVEYGFMKILYNMCNFIILLQKAECVTMLNT